MKKHTSAFRKIGGCMTGSLMLLSGMLLPYQGIALTAPETVRAAEQETASAAALPDTVVYAETTAKPAATTAKPAVTTAKPAATTVKPAATTAKPAETTAKPAATTAKPVTTRAASTTAVQTTTEIKVSENGFVFEVQDGAAVLKAYTGSAAAVKIPAAYQDVPVTEIGIGAFQENGNIVSVEIPASVRVIGSNAFNGCSSLESVKLPEKLEMLGYYVFSETAITEINIPVSLKTAQQPFYACKSLNKVTFADGIKSIPADLFKRCYGLNEITVPDTVTAIGSGAFEDCTKLKKVSLPDSLTEIGSNAFNGCSSLESVKLPEKLETLGYYVFSETAITEINIPVSLKTAQQPFYACKSLNKVTFADGIKSIPADMFKRCYGLTEITVPDTVTAIGSDAFEDCTKLKKVSFPDAVTIIGSNAFNGCGSLESVKLPEKLETLGYYAFDGTAITEINIPASLKTAQQPFLACKSLSKVTFADGIKSIPENLFKNCTGLTEITIPDSVTKIGGSAFADCRNLKKVTLSDKLETIGYYAFSDTALTEIRIPASLNYAPMVFDMCRSLNKVTFADGIKSIPENLFKNCYGLTEITIPDSVTEIGGSAFADCRNLTKVTLPRNVETIGYYAFSDTALTEIRIPASLNYAPMVFDMCKSLNKVTFADGIKMIPANLFKNCYGLTEITVPDSVTEIGANAFAYCRNLTKVTLPDGLETLDSYAFENSGLTEIRIPASLKTAKYPFASCSALAYAELAEGMETVPAYLFDHARALKMVRLASTTKSIGQYAFASCKKLSTIEPPELEPDFSASSFESCDLLFDQRFCLLDRIASGITVNSVIGSVSGLAHFTVKYRLDERTADPELKLDIPGILAIVPESVVCTDADMTIMDNSDRFLLKAHEGTLHFSARVQRTGDGPVTAKMRFRFRGDAWEQPVGTVNVTAPELTVSAPETVNGLSVQVCGIAGKEQTVEICVNGKSAASTVSDPYTGKYRVTVQLPQGEDGTVYQISAKTEKTETEKLAVTYRKNAPTVQAVTLFHNKYADEGLDITDVFTEGRSPVISYNPSRAMQFTVKTTNPELIDRLFVTSTKGQDVQYMEAFYDAEQDLWVTPKSYFIPENRNYVPGTLNISILEKQQEIVADAKNTSEYDAIMHLPDTTPQAYRDNSTLEVLAKTDSGFAADVNFTDGSEDHEFLYCSERTDTVTVNGQSVTAEEIAKDPEKYGYRKVPASAVSGDERYTYYQRWDDGQELMLDLSAEIATSIADSLVGAYTGYSVLEMAEGDHKNEVVPRFINNFIVSKTQTHFDGMTGGLYGEYAAFLRLAGDTVHLGARLYEARDNEYQQSAAVMLFAAQVIVDSGGLELMLLTCGASLPVTLLVTVTSCVVLSYASDWLDEWISGGDGSMFSSGGFLRLIIDPSGTVYEAVKSNPVAGAEVRIYYRDPETGKQTEWNAADYEQENPLITGPDGDYAWDVPEGEWKVVCTKSGYDKAESDWLTVPPVRTDVWLALVDHSAPVVVKTEEQADGLLVQFSKYIDISTANETSILLKGAAAYTVKPVLHAEGDAYTDSFLLAGDFSAGNDMISVTKALLSYAGTPADPADVKLTWKQETRKKGDIDGDGSIDAADAQRTLAEYVSVMSGKAASFDEAQKKAADVDGNGIVSVEDAQNILKYYVHNTVAGKTVTWEEILQPADAQSAA